MKPTDYITSLLPNFEKARITTDIDAIRAAITETIIPKYTAAAEAFDGHKFQGDFTQKIDAAYKKSGAHYKGNFVASFLSTMEGASKKLDKLDALVSKSFHADVIATGITYQKAQLMQYVEVLGFTVRYARRLLLMTYTLETPNAIVDKPTKNSITYLVRNLDTFLIACAILSKKQKDFENELDAIPEMIINAEQDALVTNTTAGATDPNRMGLIPVSLNPIYHVRMSITKWKIACHKENVEDARLIDLKLLHLKNMRTGKADLGLERQISYYEDRIRKLRFTIKEMLDE